MNKWDSSWCWYGRADLVNQTTSRRGVFGLPKIGTLPLYVKYRLFRTFHHSGSRKLGVGKVTWHSHPKSRVAGFPRLREIAGSKARCSFTWQAATLLSALFWTGAFCARKCRQHYCIRSFSSSAAPSSFPPVQTTIKSSTVRHQPTCVS